MLHEQDVEQHHTRLGVMLYDLNEVIRGLSPANRGLIDRVYNYEAIVELW
jgi:hypothetical protein